MENNEKSKKQYNIEDFYVGVVITNLLNPFYTTCISNGGLDGAVAHTDVEFWNDYSDSRYEAILMLFRKRDYSTFYKADDYYDYWCLHAERKYRKFNYCECCGLFDEPVQLLKFLPKVDLRISQSITEDEAKIIFSKLFEVSTCRYQHERAISQYVAYESSKFRIFRKSPVQGQFYFGEKLNARNFYFGNLSLRTRRLIRVGQTGSDMCLNVPDDKMLIVHGAIRKSHTGLRQSYECLCNQNTYGKTFPTDNCFSEIYDTIFIETDEGMLNLHNNQIYLPSGDDHYCKSSLEHIDDSVGDLSVPDALTHFSKQKRMSYRKVCNY